MSAGTPVHDDAAIETGVEADRDGDTSDRVAPGWWIALGVAVAFLVAAGAFVLGTHLTDPQDSYGTVDRGFLADMINHHDQAVLMAAMTQGRATDQVVESFAEEVISFQRWETGVMDEMLAQAGTTRSDSDPDRLTMDWMHMPTPLRVMPGMASPEQLERLESAEGRDLDILFLELMRDHHEGGLHMAEYAAEHADNPRVRELAARMARNQRVEVNEYNARLRLLGVDVG